MPDILVSFLQHTGVHDVRLVIENNLALVKGRNSPQQLERPHVPYLPQNKMELRQQLRVIAQWKQDPYLLFPYLRVNEYLKSVRVERAARVIVELVELMNLSLQSSVP
jgi:hypothetical protein